MITKLFNPFRYIAGGYSLIIGVLVLFLTALIGFYSNIHFPDLISVKTGPNLPLQFLIIQSLSNWIVMSVVLYLISLFASNSKVRAIDIFGTQAFARFPYLIASFIGFSNSMENFGKYILWELMQKGEPIELNAGEITIAISIMILTLFLTIWLVILMYNAFKISANLKGYKLNLSFIAGFIVSLLLTILISNQLIQNF